MGDEKLQGVDRIMRELAECEARLRKYRVDRADAPEDLDGIEEELNHCKIQLEDAKEKSEEAWAEAKHTVVTRLDRLKRRLDSRAGRQTGGIQ